MTDRELNALVAERVMGLRNVRVYTGHEDLSREHICGEGIGAGFIYDRHYSDYGYEVCNVPDYCNDIAAAWRVALKIASMSGYGVTIHVGDEVWIEKTVETDDGSNHLITWQDVARVGTSEGDARAICLAALKAVGVDAE